MSDDRKALAPCPFCGGVNLFNDWVRDGRSVGCRTCSARVTCFEPNASAKAEDAWSRRAALQPAAAAQGAPFLWLRTLDGKPDWSEDCVGKTCDELLLDEHRQNDSRYDAMPLYAAPPSAPAAQGHDARDAARYRYWRGAMVAICAEAPFDNFDLADALSEAETSDDYDRAIDAALALSPPQIDGEAK